jgi:hypothetical protein
MTDEYGREHLYPVNDPDRAWRRFRRVLSSQHSLVLVDLRKAGAAWLEETDEEVGDHCCVRCDGVALTMAELVKLIDVELDVRHSNVMRTIDAITEDG